MKENIKITEEEQNTIRDLQMKFQKKLGEFGTLYVEKMGIDAAIKAMVEKETSVQNEWRELQKQENILVESILKKYGEGSLDLAKGVFIPIDSSIVTT